MPQTNFQDHTVVARHPDDYLTLEVDVSRLLKAWKSSLFSHELLNQDGTVKNEDQLSGDALKSFISARESFHKGEELIKPVLGIGIYDGVEIGIGREIVAVAAHEGITTIPVSVRKGQMDEISALIL